MRILTTCASRNKTDLISVSLNSAADDDEFITEVGTYFYKVLKENWIEAPHTDVGEKRSNMIERHKNNYRSRIRLEIKYRGGRPLFRLDIDRMPKKVDTPFGQQTIQFTTDVKEKIFDAVCAVIFRNQKVLSDCVFECDGKRIYDNGKWSPESHEVLSKLREDESAGSCNNGNRDERMCGSFQEVGRPEGETQAVALQTLDGGKVE